jgi:RimJ/RimL family protein N-acetyltransferase
MPVNESLLSMHTRRLILADLSLDDSNFILRLLNTSDWIRFIGDRNVKTEDDAREYVRQILSRKTVTYWVVKLIDGQQPIGIITLIKRDYLDHPDFGFAFLPDHSGKGYAFEASRSFLSTFKGSTETHLLAITIPGNQRSIRLLEKLGFTFEKEILRDSEVLRVYSIAIEHEHV